MNMTSLVVITVAMLAFSLISGRLRGTLLTPPLFFIVLGFVIGIQGWGFVKLDPGRGAVHTIAEITLILILFTDASRIDLKQLRRDHNLPVRMLLVGLPIAMALGGLVASVFFPELTVWEAILLSALLVPTDAALGQSVVSNPAVPVRIRQAINVESGLNDGLALPAVLLFAALASGGHDLASPGEWMRFGIEQVTLGPLVGVVVGYVGARLFSFAADRRWLAGSFQGIGVLSLAVMAFAGAELIGGNGFIAAFIGGLVFGSTLRQPSRDFSQFMEVEGQLLMVITFLVFGGALLPEALRDANVATVLYALLSLTLLRMVPVAISLFGAGLRWPTQLFLGWFGPRGLASILFVLLILEESDVPHASTLFSVTVVTVALSALLHGVTAAPFSHLYGRLTNRMGECEENQTVVELPLR